MSQKYIAFDIETAKEVPGDDFNWRPHRPLGITCIASLSDDDGEPRLWHGTDADGTPASQMSQQDAAAFVRYLAEMSSDGSIPLTWNGLAFDYDILAEESGMTDECQRQAKSHVDMMFHVVCEKGFPVSLANAASGMGVAGKLSGVSGLEAPALWAAGEYDKVLAYVAQDVRVTRSIASQSERSRDFRWTTRRGSLGHMPLPRGWLSVSEALRLPLPDTSWMSDPPQRNNFLAWLSAE